MRQTLIIANFKMNYGPMDGHEYIHKLEFFLQKKKPLVDNIAIAVPFITIPYVLPHHHDEIKDIDNSIKIGAQNCCWELSGNFTGEISPVMLDEIGVEYVLLGHSDRRNLFHETDELINKKVKLILENTEFLKPIIIIGEFEEKQGFEFVNKQLNTCLNNLGNKRLDEIIIAYEPAWAIGKEEAVSPEYAQENIGKIRKELAKMFSEDIAKKITLLYGGSVTEKTLSGLLSKKDIDGVLVGRIGLDPKRFAEFITHKK